MGIDYIQLLPIHPLGVLSRKGSIGSPYSIKDYRSFNPDYGTEADFKELLKEAHSLGLKVIMDIVFNHTSRDSILTIEHPEWFYHKPNGEFANRVGDWSDITDFKFEYPELEKYLSDTLLYYVRLGVDGFRFDVASLIPYEFFAYTFQLLRKENPEIFLLAESVHLGFCKYLRDLGYDCISDAELFTLFDALYEYDSYDYLYKYMKGECGIQEYLSRVEAQEAQFSKNYVKVRYLENHDFGTANSYLKDDTRLKNLMVLSYFCKGMAFLFNGIECCSRHLPNLFEIDEIDWDDYNRSHMADFITTLNTLKKKEVFSNGVWEYHLITDSVVTISLKNKEEEYIAILNLNHSTGMVNIEISGKFKNVLTGEILSLDKYLKVSDDPMVLLKINNEK
jgi:glycosidase